MSRRAGPIYRTLLLLLPRRLRESFGRDMEQLYLDRVREARGPWKRAGIRLDALRDIVWQATLERFERADDGTDGRSGMWKEGWIQDIRFGLRTLWRRPGFSAAAIGTLALGIGATVSIFSVVHSVLLEPLPYPDSEDLVVMWNEDASTGGSRSRTSDHPDVRLIQERVPGLAVAGYTGTRPTLTGFGDPQVVYGVRTTDGLVELMGLQPELGRDLLAADDVPGGANVVVISHSFWVERLAGDPAVLGRTLSFNDTEWEVVGVAPEGFDYPGGSEFWMPRQHVLAGCGHGCRMFSVVGRLAPDASFEGVQQRLDAVSAELAESEPNSHRDSRFALESMLDYEVAGVRTALWVLLGAVGMVLMIACANVANLMLVRATGRRDEVTLRVTLGASRMRIVRQLLTESLLLAAAAGTLGLALARWGTLALIRLAPDSLPRLDDFAMDPAVFGFAAALVVVVAGVFGVLPAMRASREAVPGTGRRHAGDRHSDHSRSALLVAEVALSLTLLVGTGLLVRTLGEIRAVDLGFDTESIERFRVSLPDARYDSLAVGEFLLRLEDELTAIPGVSAAGFGFGVPLGSGGISGSVSFLDRPEVDPADQPSLEIRPSTPGLLAAMGMPLIRGRWLERSDRYGMPGVAVLNEAAVRQFFGGRDPTGVEIEVDVSWGFEETPNVTVVGVVGDVIRGSPTEVPVAAMYLSNQQFGANSGYFTVRLENGFATAIPDARRRITELDPSLAIYDVAKMGEVVKDARAETTFYASLLTVFSIVALLLAAIGLYGVVSYTVAQRTREIGIRIALGAASDDVTGMVVRQGIRPAVLGIVVGLVSSWFSTRLLSSMLFGVRWEDPLTLTTVTLGLLAVTLAATAFPARRATRVPPSDALRAE